LEVLHDERDEVAREGVLMRLWNSRGIRYGLLVCIIGAAGACRCPDPCPTVVAPQVQPGSTQQRIPTPGPIITVEPKKLTGSTYEARWSTLTAGELAEAGAGDSGYLRSDLFDLESYDPLIRFLRAETSRSQTVNLSSLTLNLTKGNDVNKIKVWKDPDDYDRIKWSVNGTPLQKCYIAPSTCTPLCKANSHGLPPEFYGTWDLAATVTTAPYMDPTLFAKAKSRADCEPCP
jgi:hypothetical protein